MVTRNIMKDGPGLQGENIDIIRAHINDIINDGYAERQSPNKLNVVKIKPEGIRLHMGEDSYTAQHNSHVAQKEEKAKEEAGNKTEGKKDRRFNRTTVILTLIFTGLSVVANVVLSILYAGCN